MASSCVVPVVELKNVRPHPNADKLEICDVLGYQMCVPKGRYKDGDVGVYFPADVLLPAEWAEKFEVRNFLRGKNKDRVGKIKLRGEPSFGLVVDIPEGQDWKLGDNVADYFGATKYEPPIRPGVQNMAAYDGNIDPYFEEYTDIENGKLFIDIFEEGEEVIATEKIHGTNSRVGIINGCPVAGSHTTRKQRPREKIDTHGVDKEIPCEWDSNKVKHDIYWSPWSIEKVRRLLLTLAEGGRSVILYGEVYGRSIQSLGYGYEKGKGFGYRAFDLKINGKYLDYDGFASYCTAFGIEQVPVIYRGPFYFEKINEVADGQSIMPNANHCREGVVVKPVHERNHVKIGRVVLKYIGTEYSLGKHSDYKDV